MNPTCLSNNFYCSQAMIHLFCPPVTLEKEIFDFMGNESSLRKILSFSKGWQYGVLPSSGLVHFSGSTRSIWIHLLHLQMGVNPLPRSAILNKWAALTKETRNLHNSLLSHYILATQKKAYIKIKQVEIRNKSQISTGDKINSHLINDQVFKFRSIA